MINIIIIAKFFRLQFHILAFLYIYIILTEVILSKKIISTVSTKIAHAVTHTILVRDGNIIIGEKYTILI